MARPAAMLAALLPLLPAVPVSAKETAIGRETYWDQMMAAQAIRDVNAGYDHMEKRDYSRAVGEFTKAVVARPRDPVPRLMLGSALYWSGEVDKAGFEFAEAVKLDPANAQAHLLLGIVHAWKGDVPASYKSFQESARLDPNRSDVQMNLGSIEETLGRYPEALDHFRKAAALDPKSPLYQFQLGMLYRRLGRDGEAIDSLRQALRNFPEFEDAMLELGAALERKDKVAEAAQIFKKAVRLKSRDAVARLRLARTQLLLSKPEDAREVLRDAFHLTPEDKGGGLALSVSFGGQPKADSPPSSDSPPRPEEEPKDPLDMLARNLERVPLDQEARLQVEMAFLPRPKLERAAAREAGGRLKQAMEEAGKPAPRPVGVKREYNLPGADAGKRREQIAKAIDDLRDVLKQAPPDSETRMAMNLSFSKAAPAGGPGTPETSPKASYQPRDVGNDLGLWVMGTGWMGLVEEVLPVAGEPPPQPESATWWVAHGLAFAALGKGREALDSFERAIELDGQDELALLGRAVGFVELGREPEAVAAYRRLLEIHPKNKAAKDGLAWLLRPPAKGP